MSTIISSIIIDFLNIVAEIYIRKCESEALEEDFFTYSLLCLRGLHGWVPYLHIFQAKEKEL